MWRAVSQVPTQIRDGVGVDRDSERARGGIKFDFEVVPPQVAYLMAPAPTDSANSVDPAAPSLAGGWAEVKPHLGTRP